ncbi:NAD(P)-binding Rossmann-fold superfamily protein [Klebsormidium nitens]|uniref:NAD(P)-binding Rossmann-fold superfamily protein n=1 Tax=Klebsormidium nitens TaxID=105231 RepID=A0A1Y1I5X9_KLENI|nr:NAD(P)-binding Rossmann-fold superfamily protein [Klebsormidium nitens]|eukprot:GAQ85362.1 NAD(P)-binding Rossmann-fold superfamily protein [Klebsormidium nitens]
MEPSDITSFLQAALAPDEIVKFLFRAWLIIVGLFWNTWAVLAQRWQTRRWKQTPDAVHPYFTRGRNFIVTGPTSGIGKETAKELALCGANVVLACRDVSAGQKVLSEIKKEGKKHKVEVNVEVVHLDLRSFMSVRAFAHEWEQRGQPLHCLINNAGVFIRGLNWAPITEEGFEEHFQVNFLAPALLSLLLLPSLLQGAPSRIVNITSEGHKLVTTVDLEGMRRGKGKHWYAWSMFGAYCQSKLASTIFSIELHRRLPSTAHTEVVAMHPGFCGTEGIRNFLWVVQWFYKALGPLLGIFLTCNEGARGPLFAATSPVVVAQARRLRALQSRKGPYYNAGGYAETVGPQAQDPRLAAELWDETMHILNLPTDYVERKVSAHLKSRPETAGREAEMIEAEAMNVTLPEENTGWSRLVGYVPQSWFKWVKWVKWL